MSHIIGIDVSKASLDCAYVRDPDQQKVQRRTCKNKVNCFASLVAWAEARSGRPVQSLAFIIEPTHVYHEQLVQFLHHTGATVYLVNPGKVRKFAEGIGILSKNDLIDAGLLVRYGLMARNKPNVCGKGEQRCQAQKKQAQNASLTFQHQISRHCSPHCLENPCSGVVLLRSCTGSRNFRLWRHVTPTGHHFSTVSD